MPLVHDSFRPALWFGTLAVVAGSVLAPAFAPAQPAPAQPAAAPRPEPPAPTGLVVGSGNFFSPIVADLDAAVAFYGAVGVEFDGAPANADSNPELRALLGLPNARIRWQLGRVPTVEEGGLEIVEVTGVDGQRVARRIQDPGSAMLTVFVRDVDATLARVKALGASVITRGGEPVTVRSPELRIVVVQDPGGNFVELAQPRNLPARAPATANAFGVRMRHTVQDLGSALALYRDALGLQGMNRLEHSSRVPPYGAYGPIQDAMGLGPDMIYRYAELAVPGSRRVIELIEWKDMRRHAARARLQDTGSSRVQLLVADIDAAAGAVVRAGGTFVSTGGKPLDLPAGDSTLKAGIVRDPDDLFLVLIQAPAVPAQ